MGFAVWALVSGALLGGCAGGGSSVTQSAGTAPSAAQRGSVPGGQGSPARAGSGARRTQSVPTCSGSGTGSFVGINESNVAAGLYSVEVGGSQNQACDQWSSIVAGNKNAVSGSSTSGFIGGGESNVVTGEDQDSTVVAGDDNQVSNFRAAIVGGELNSVAAQYSLVGAGLNNTISLDAPAGAIVSGDGNNLSGQYGFIGAGLNNTMSAPYGVLIGGTQNTVSGEGGYIAAGAYNMASGEGAVVDGGFNATASGNFATIPGGYGNTAAGTYSFAAGARANAAQNGTFVWSDGSDGSAILTSTAAYQFLARAAGGFTLYTNAGATVGAQLAAGSGTWASLSDRNQKTNIAPLDDELVLDKVASLPISRWSYKSEHGVRHVGPMAQDFYAAFKVGEDDKHITSIDEDGVALAAIKALHAENIALRRELAAERAHDRRVDAELGRIAGALRQ